MRFDKTQFSQLISDQSGLDKETTDQLIDALLNEILAGIEKNGNYTLKGFGQFVQTSDAIKFYADDVLALELNFEFAGLEPIEVAPAVKLPSTSALFDKEELSKEDIDFEDDELIDEEEIEAPPSLSLTDKEIANLEEDEETGGWEYEVDEGVADIIPKSDEDSELEEFDIADMPALEPDQRMKEVNKEKAFSKFRSDQEKERKSNYVGVIATVVIAVLIALASWFVLKPYLENKALENEPTTVDAVEKNEDTATEKDSLSLNAIPAEPSAKDVVIEQNNQLEEAEESDRNAMNSGEDKAELAAIPEKVEAIIEEDKAEKTPPSKTNTGIQFGLYGKDVAKIENSTTIVVHSLGSKASADRVADDLRNQGYKTAVFLTKMSDGQQFWRVGIGQFQNFEAAAKIREGLDEPFKSRSFVAKITF